MITEFLALIGLGLALGLRHGIDWDHIAAITDITSSTVTNKEAELEVSLEAVAVGAGGAAGVMTAPLGAKREEILRGFTLATMYALGHATLVMLLGLLAIWAGALLPEWVDPLMERIVGVTLVVLGAWIFYALWRYGSSFQLKSRWMLIFSLIGRGWGWLTNTIRGQPHSHDYAAEVAQYGPRTAYGIGVIHGIGAETGSQALLLASAAGATSAATGTVLLLAFAVGLLASNTLVALFSLAGFISSSTKHHVYVVIGVLAGIFSLVVGFYFLTGRGGELPDLQHILDTWFGMVR